VSLHVMSNLIQGTEEWLAARRGIVTASVVGQLVSTRPPSGITVACPECSAPANDPCISRARKEPAPIKTLHASRVAPEDAPRVVEPAANDTSRALTNLLVAERITGWTDPVYVSDDMLRGTLEEPIARDLYSRTYAPAAEVGFMVRDDWGYPIGYSPDGLVGDDGLIEVKSRRQKKHLATILANEVPIENMAQIQAGLLVSGRQWCDYLSYCAGMPMWPIRVTPDPRWADAIVEAVAIFERTAEDMVAAYQSAVAGLPATERVNHYLDGVI
jgi:hypothetical protein